MKQTLFILSLLMYCMGNAQNSPAPPSDRAKKFAAAVTHKTYPPAATPEQAIRFFFDGLSELSETKVHAYVTNDFMLLEDGKLWNTDSLTVRFAARRVPDFKRINRFRFLRTDIGGKTATVAYYNHADITINGNQRSVDWLESAQLIKERGGWKIKLLHATKLNYAP